MRSPLAPLRRENRYLRRLAYFLIEYYEPKQEWVLTAFSLFWMELECCPHLVQN